MSARSARPELTRITPAMARFVHHFGEMGPRWGIEADTCRAHALLYLSGGPLSRQELARALDIDSDTAKAALDDLVDWGMARRAGERWDASGEPWDLLFSALEQRRRREIGPALDMLRRCRAEAAQDAATPPPVRDRIGRMVRLIEDLAAIDAQAARFSAGTFGRLVSAGGLAARLLNKALPSTARKS